MVLWLSPLNGRRFCFAKLSSTIPRGVVIIIIHTVLFDLDGTLLDTLGDLTDSVNDVMRSYGLPLHDTENVRTFIGNGIAKLMERAMPALTPKDVLAESIEKFRTFYQVNQCRRTQPYIGIPQMLSVLLQAGYGLGVVSNKYEEAAIKLCTHFFGNTFGTVLGDMPERPKKPSPDGVLEAIRRLNGCTAESIYIGDSETDVQTAKQAGIPCIGVSWGFRGRNVLTAAGADFIVDKPEDILQLLSKLRRHDGNTI